MPAVTDYGWAAELIAALAARTGTAAFRPHLTVHSGVGDPELLAEVLEGETMEPLRLRIRGVGATEEFFRSVFLEFEESALLRALHETLGRSIRRDAPKPFQPHLSLLYAELPLQEKKALAQGVLLTQEEILFDTLLIVRKPREGWRDVGGWEILRHIPLL